MNTRAVVAYPSANRSGTVSWVRIVAAGGGRGGIRHVLVSPSTRNRIGERVPQQHDVADPAHLGERRAPVRVPREPTVADEPPGPGVADEERCDDQVQLVGEVGGQELGVHRPAALDHQPVHAPGVQVLAHPSHVDRLAAVDHGRHAPEPVARLGRRSGSRSRPASRRRRW